MKFAFTKHHLDFFYQNHYIEFENLLSSNELQQLKKDIYEILGNRLHSSPDQLDRYPLKALYLAGFDSWRSSLGIKKMTLLPRLAEIASNLVKEKTLRIGFDQIFFTPLFPNPSYLKDLLPPLFKQELTLSQMSCLDNVACGLILQISPPTPLPESLKLLIQGEGNALIPTPHAERSGIFFSPKTLLSLEYLTALPNQLQLLIVYVKDTSLYRLNSRDPHTHEYKKFGYIFGDKLKNSTHPILYRSS